jgi:UDP-GlcNAc3NAcA epimerase
VKIVTVVGARPQFIKAAVISRVLARRGGANREVLIHTGQHFDDAMSAVFFRELEISQPHHHLGIASCSHGAMTGRMLEAVERVLLAELPDRVLVYGDTNSTLAGALAAAKLNIPLAHVEAGLRSGDRRMPEEVNRILTDHAADLLFAPTAQAMANLEHEGLGGTRARLVGDVMYDAFIHDAGRAARSAIPAALGLREKGYALATVHRAASTDDSRRLRGLVDGLCAVRETIEVVCPLHPRTRLALAREGLLESAAASIRFIEPVGYFDMLALERSAAVILTDSGGVQKEAYFHGVPCVTLREETEWTELVDLGANRLAGCDAEAVRAACAAALQSEVPRAALYGDGKAGEAIVDHLLAWRGSKT